MLKEMVNMATLNKRRQNLIGPNITMKSSKLIVEYSVPQHFQQNTLD